MELAELIKIKEQIIEKYNSELRERNLSNQKEAFDEELKSIKREIDKVDELIEIYKHQDIEYRVMKLERLYMQIIAEMTKEAFSRLTEEEEFDIFDELFPDNWPYHYTLEKKEEYLKEAICTNKEIKYIIPNTNKKVKNSGVYYER